MKTTITILKGVLLYVTLFFTLLFICGVDSIYDNGYFIHCIVILAVLFLLCYKYISVEDIEKITFTKIDD
jgi:hypothetical protein